MITPQSSFALIGLLLIVVPGPAAAISGKSIRGAWVLHLVALAFVLASPILYVVLSVPRDGTEPGPGDGFGALLLMLEAGFVLLLYLPYLAAKLVRWLRRSSKRVPQAGLC